MKIICAASLLYGQEAFSTLGDVVIVPDAEITSDTVRDADALVVRSKTRVDLPLLADSRVRFVGTATAGMDHIDVAGLKAQGITCVSAAGCNANSVAEYIVAALYVLRRRHGLNLADLKLGVVGVGHVGRRVVAKAQALGMQVLQNDPPRYEVERDPVLRPLPEVLQESDIVTLHVPLITSGPWPSAHLADHRFFAELRPGTFFINSCRGEVTDSGALAHALQHGPLNGAVLDVWENEPFVPPALLEQVDLGTAHIAGYSWEGRLDGTVLVYEALCDFFHQEQRWQPDRGGGDKICVDGGGRSDEEVVGEVVAQAYDILYDDALLREASCPPESGAAFNRLRKGYRTRREFAAHELQLQRVSETGRAMLTGIGFTV